MATTRPLTVAEQKQSGPTVNWFPGLRLEDTISPEQKTLLEKILSNPQATTHSGPKMAELIRSLAQTVTAMQVVADASYQAAKDATRKLQTTEQNYQQLQIHAAQSLQKLETQEKTIQDLQGKNSLSSAVIKQIEGFATCPVCKEPALSAKAVGPCGHIACETCLKAPNKFLPHTASHSHSGEKCPVCEAQTLGQGVPVLPISQTLFLLSRHNLITIPNSTLKKSEYPAIESAIDAVMREVTQNQWLNGVYILFEKGASSILFTEFTASLKQKALFNIHIDEKQRLLAVKLQKPLAADEKKSDVPNTEPLQVLIFANGSIKINSPHTFTVRRA